MGYRFNRLDEPIFMAGPKPMRTEFGIHLRLESCDTFGRDFAIEKQHTHFRQVSYESERDFLAKSHIKMSPTVRRF